MCVSGRSGGAAFCAIVRDGGSQPLKIRLWCLALRVVELRAGFLELLQVDVAVTFLYAAIGEARLVEA